MAKNRITSGTVRFISRNDKIRKDLKAPIEIVYSLHGQRKTFNSGFAVFPALWDVESQQAIYQSKKNLKGITAGLPSSFDLLPTLHDINELNAKLEQVKIDLKKVEDFLESKSERYTSADVKQEYDNRRKNNSATKKEDSKNYLVDFINHYVASVMASRNSGTIKVYITTRNHIADYEKENRVRVALLDAGYGFLQSFYNYLIEVKGQINITATKQITTIKTFLAFARKYGHKTNETYHDFTVRRETLEVIALSEGEFLTLYNLNLIGEGSVIIDDKSATDIKATDKVKKPRTISFKALSKVRDVFCFSCVTGLRYSDLAQLRKEHIRSGYIKLTVTKTKEPIEVPLTSYATEILSRYPHQIKCLPIISSQKFNEYLKALCKHASINEAIEIVRYKGAKREAAVYPKYELISAHTGRKTFATLSLEKGLNAEEVMSITGHKSYASFKRYVNVTKERKRAAMLKAWGAPGDLSITG